MDAMGKESEYSYHHPFSGAMDVSFREGSSRNQRLVKYITYITHSDSDWKIWKGLRCG